MKSGGSLLAQPPCSLLAENAQRPEALSERQSIVHEICLDMSLQVARSVPAGRQAKSLSYLLVHCHLKSRSNFQTAQPCQLRFCENRCKDYARGRSTYYRVAKHRRSATRIRLSPDDNTRVFRRAQNRLLSIRHRKTRCVAGLLHCKPTATILVSPGPDSRRETDVPD